MILLIAFFRIYSFSSIPISSISAPARFTSDEIKDWFSISVSIIHSSMVFSPNRRAYTLFSTACLSTPNPLVVFPWGSMSMVSTFCPISDKQAERLIAVVVFPTPPFWLAIDMTLPMLFSFVAVHFLRCLSKYNTYMFHVKHIFCKYSEPCTCFINMRYMLA